MEKIITCFWLALFFPCRQIILGSLIMIKCLFSDHLAKVKSRKPVECQATHVLFLRVGSLCLSWFLSSPAGEASSVNVDTASYLSSILIAASMLKWGPLLIDSVLALEMFTASASSCPLCWPWVILCLWGSGRNGAGGGESAGLLFKLLIFPERCCWGRCWCGLRAVHFANLQSGWLCIDFISLF